MGGATVGGVVEASHLPQLEGPTSDAIRERVPKGSSAIVVIATAERVREVEDRLRPLRPGVGRRQDARTEAAVLRAFVGDDALPAETIHVAASDGTVTLSGSVELAYKRDEAETVARHVPGVSQIRNDLSVWMAVSPNEVLDRVADAIGSDSAARLTVTASDNVVTLSGTVRCAGDRDAAIAAAAAAPMVAGVEDEIRVVA